MANHHQQQSQEGYNFSVLLYVTHAWKKFVGISKIIFVIMLLFLPLLQLSYYRSLIMEQQSNLLSYLTDVFDLAHLFHVLVISNSFKVYHNQIIKAVTIATNFVTSDIIVTNHYLVTELPMPALLTQN
jgi:hypothetical protein